MRVLVPFKSVPDPYAVNASDPSAPAKVRMINPFDAIAIEEALVMRERGEVEEVSAVTIGSADIEEEARSALAMGANRVIRVDDNRELDAYAVARILLGVVQRESPHLIIMGKQATDTDAGQTGQMLAGLLDWAQATFVSKIRFTHDQQRLECTRETDAGLQTIAVELPAVVTTDLRLNEPRYVSLPGLMKARRKPIEVLTHDDLGVNVSPRSFVRGYRPVSKRRACTQVESIKDLVDKLRHEAKVL